MKVIKVKSCRECPHLVTYKPQDDWENEKEHDWYCGKYDVGKSSKIRNIDEIDAMCPLEELKTS